MVYGSLLVVYGFRHCDLYVSTKEERRPGLVKDGAAREDLNEEIEKSDSVEVGLL